MSKTARVKVKFATSRGVRSVTIDNTGGADANAVRGERVLRMRYPEIYIFGFISIEKSEGARNV